MAFVGPPSLRSRATAEVAAAIAVATIVFSAVCLKAGHPGSAGAPAVVATAVLVATPYSAVARILLSASPARAVGRLSYAAYIVHWPLYVFADFVARGVSLPALHHPTILTITTTVVPRALNRSVALPLRRSTSLLPYRKTFAMAAVVTVTLALWAVGSGGWAALKVPHGELHAGTATCNLRKRCVDLIDEREARRGRTGPTFCAIL